MILGIGLRSQNFFAADVVVFATKEFQQRITKKQEERQKCTSSVILIWTAYDGLVDIDKMHLAPRHPKGNHSVDMDLNLGDWKHFITADILLVGGTFLNIASIARDYQDETTGLLLSIHICKFSNIKDLCSNADNLVRGMLEAHCSRPDGYRVSQSTVSI